MIWFIELALELLDHLPTSVIAEIVEKMHPRLYIDFIRYLPTEICLKILGYLDPVSLLFVAQTCRDWYILALDRKLWEKLYQMEGWKAVTSEIQTAEERVNNNLIRSAAGSMQRHRSGEDGHTYKKRAVSSPRTDDDEDFHMMDADHHLYQEPGHLEMGESSIFGGAAEPAFLRSSMTPAFGDLNMGGSGSSWSSVKGKSADKGKGKAVAAPPVPEFSHVGSTPDPYVHQVKSTLWMWDGASGRYRINWKHLYTMRMKLESNWEQGNYKNFQLPHPDHPEEGHNNECIYSLQFNDEYLVSGSRDRTLRIWNLATRRLVRKPLVGHIGSVLCLQFDSDPEEDIIVSGSSDSDVIIWKFSTGEIIQRLANAHRESVLNVKFDKRILVTCSKDKTIKIFNRRPLKSGDQGYNVSPVPITIRKYGYEMAPELDIIPAFTMIGVLDGHNAAVNAVQIVDNEVVSASGDRQIKVWDWHTGVCIRTFVGHQKGIACVQYDGKRIVSGSSDNEVKVFCRETGVEVASLKAHTDLVRTVQSGFGDLPWSTEEDMAEAKQVDQDYFKALESGRLSSTPQRGRTGNAGSRRPEDITAYGAKVPPGGGGGKYGRIVSGSYDKSIIIWRRDKNGVWKAKHHLKQEAAHSNVSRAAAAVAANAVAARVAVNPGTDSPQLPGHGSSTAATAGNSTAAGSSSTSAQASSSRHQPPVALIPDNASALAADQAAQATDPVLATMTPTSLQSYAQIIDLIVPQGVHALQQALASYPAMLSLQTHLQTAIDRETSLFVRSQLRQAVSTAAVRTQLAQQRAREQTYAAIMGGMNSEASGSGSGSQSHAAAGQSSGAAGSSSTAPAVGHNDSNTATGPPPPPSTAAATLSTAAPAADAVPAPHRPHIGAPHGNGADPGVPTRVYKLQFDARRIICCSQTSVIVGWDFCNGDPELEEASRFFATID